MLQSIFSFCTSAPFISSGFLCAFSVPYGKVKEPKKKKEERRLNSSFLARLEIRDPDKLPVVLST